MSGAKDSASVKTTKLREELENRILIVVDEVDNGFKKVMTMYTIAFYFGLGLIVFALVSSLTDEGNSMAILFGGAGLIDVVAFFVFKPAEDLQHSRGNLAQLVSAFLTWYNDTHNGNEVLKKDLIKGNGHVDTYKEVSKRSIQNTISIMCAIELFVAAKISKESSQELRNILDDLRKISS